MPRPEHLNCPMTPGIIRDINSRQEAYDSDPKYYEEMQRREQEHQEQMAMQEAEERAKYEQEMAEQEEMEAQYEAEMATQAEAEAEQFG